MDDDRPIYLQSRRPIEERLESWARAVTKAIVQASGGGSEMFLRIGDEYYADPEACRQRLQDKFDMLHRQIIKAHRPIVPPGSAVDHINGDPLDNRPENLRIIDNPRK